MAAQYEWWIILADNTGEQSPEILGCPVWPRCCCYFQKWLLKGVGIGDADGLCEKKDCMLRTF